MLINKKERQQLGPHFRVNPKSSNPIFHGYTCSLYNDHLYLFGGFSYDQDRALTELKIYSIIDNSWVQPCFKGEKKLARGKFDHSACVYKDMIFFVGGRYHPEDQKSLRTTNILALDPERPENVSWVDYGEIHPGGPENCIMNLSHIHDDKMFLYNPRNFTLSYFDFINNKWKLNEVQGKSNDFQYRIMIFSENKLFGFHQDPECKESRNLLMLDLDCIDAWQKITLPDGQIPFIIPSNINCSMNGMIYIFAADQSTRDNELWSYNTGENSWERIEDSGSLLMTLEPRHTIPYKNQILSISADLQNPPSIEIHYATLSEESLRPAGISSASRKEICKENPEHFIQDAKNIYKKMMFTDVIFVVEGQEIPAHKSILAYRSQYFMSLFTSGGQEAKIQIPDIKAELFGGILQYIYCNEIELNEQLALELLPILDNYLLDSLKNICEKYLARQIRKENVISMLMTADKYKIQMLKEACFKFIVKNLEKVTDSDEVMELSKQLFLELFKFQVQSQGKVKDDYGNKRIEASEEEEEPKKSTGRRGRPRKYPLKEEEEEEEEEEKEETPKMKKRGRPPKPAF